MNSYNNRFNQTLDGLIDINADNISINGIDIQNEDQMNSLIHSSNYEYLVQTQHYLDK